MMRQGLLWLSEHQGMHGFVRRNWLAKKFASRFVAGDTVDSAVQVAKTLAAQQITSTLDLLGESVTAEAAATAARDQYLDMVDQLKQADLEVNVSVKLTQMGLDIDDTFCSANVLAIVHRAAEAGGFVRLDMEGSPYTQRTLDFYFRHIQDSLRPHCGVVIQSMMRRSAADVAKLIEHDVRVRLCKGAYLEPPDIAFPDKADVDQSYAELMERLLAEGAYPGIATHDERMISRARDFVGEHNIPRETFEFQMLYGVRRDLQRELRRQGYRLRIYIPFGQHWYPYLMRRLAERPANIAFMAGNIVRESLPRL